MINLLTEPLNIELFLMYLHYNENIYTASIKQLNYFIDRVALAKQGNNRFGSVRLLLCFSACVFVRVVLCCEWLY